jgi:hypothetical protein
MRLPLQPYAVNGVLAGALEGQKAFLDLVRKTSAPTKPEICFLDFTGVKVATTSFLRESVVAYRNHARSHWGYCYPVAANLLPPVREEFEDFMRTRGDVFVICDLDRGGRATRVRLIGQLDGKQLVALRAVVQRGEADAPTLAAEVKEQEQVATTAWNNRLAALASKGLLIEISSGRGKRYRPVLENLAYGA